MNDFKRIFKNTSNSFITRISVPLSSFVLVFFIAKYLGVRGLGKFSSAFSLFYIFQGFASLGLSQLIIREVVQNKSQAGKYLINSTLILIVSSGIMAGIMCLVANFITNEKETIYVIYILSIALIPDALSAGYQSICKAFERFEYVTISTLLGSIIKLIVGFFVLITGKGLVILMVVILFSSFIILLISLYYSLRLVQETSKKLELTFCKRILLASPYFALTIIIATIRANIDVIILIKLMGEEQVGLYSLAIKLMNICNLGISSYIMALQPVLFQLFKTKREKYESLSEDSIRYLFILVIPIVTGTTLLSDRFILLIFDQEYDSCFKLRSDYGGKLPAREKMRHPLVT